MLFRSEERACELVRSQIHEYQQNIEQLYRIISVHSADDNSIANEMQAHLNTKVCIVREEDVDFDKMFEIDCFWQQSMPSVEHMCKQVAHKLHKVLGVSHADLINETVFVSLSKHGASFYFEIDAFKKFAAKFTPVAQRLQNIWEANRYGFMIEFCDVDDRLNPQTMFVLEGRCNATIYQESYSEVLSMISRQLTLLMASAAKTKKIFKNNIQPTQFVLSPRAAAINASLTADKDNYVELTYVNDTKQERYYGLANSLKVLCCVRPSGSI